MCAEPNAYSLRWLKVFHAGIDEARTTQETTFICGCAPLPEFRKVIDVCCGMGRHARALSNHGYSVVTGVDLDADAIAEACELAGGPSYVHADIRDYQPEPGAFDVAIVMGQSFGHFDPATNRDGLGRLTTSVRGGGRVVLDLWNQEFFAAHQGERELKTPCGVVRENKRVVGDRLLVHLDYPDGSPRTIRMAVGYADANERSGAANRLGPLAFLHGLRYHEPRLSRQAAHPIRSRAL